ncbi:hypothetical protein [Cysteiniphilum sp. QT6929]|uniref:hypothetical protein n=1 Tax=Cysteiniphilum sp. QT6929 TaxID=2975055 RepID=UPI0024B34D2A|nr:hypothetical protein [Cysteiniphilum sp. QT6929]WHN66261.1 hypothetical protein NYP54_03255 [Cysteiniphilum sp. QT6929]
MIKKTLVYSFLSTLMLGVGIAGAEQKEIDNKEADFDSIEWVLGPNNPFSKYFTIDDAGVVKTSELFSDSDAKDGDIFPLDTFAIAEGGKFDGQMLQDQVLVRVVETSTFSKTLCDFDEPVILKDYEDSGFEIRECSREGVTVFSIQAALVNVYDPDGELIEGFFTEPSVEYRVDGDVASVSAMLRNQIQRTHFFFKASPDEYAYNFVDLDFRVNYFGYSKFM